jgi:hypothetical protein
VSLITVGNILNTIWRQHRDPTIQANFGRDQGVFVLMNTGRDFGEYGSLNEAFEL